MKKVRFTLTLCIPLCTLGSVFAQNLFPTKGSVGIGTAQPTKLLDVNGDTRVNGWLWMDSPTSTSPRIQSAKELLLQTDNGQPILLNPLNGGGDVYVGGPQATKPALLVRGKLGIGTDSPKTQLQVAGDATIEGELNLTGSVENGSRVISNQRLILQTLNNQPIVMNPFAGGGDVNIGKNLVVAQKVTAQNLEVVGEINMTAGASTGARFISNQRLILQSLNNQGIFLNPFDGGGDVGIGKNLTVNGKISSQTLELTSDRNQKTSLENVAPIGLLEKFSALPTFSWAFTNSPTVKHLGPMAQDFKSAFGLGDDDKHINAGDAIGVSMVAIKGLIEITKNQETAISALKQELNVLQKRLSEGAGDGDLGPKYPCADSTQSRKTEKNVEQPNETKHAFEGSQTK